MDQYGNLQVLVTGAPTPGAGQVVSLNLSSSQSLGDQINVGQAGGPVQFNFEFNAPTTLRGFQAVTGGDNSTDFSAGAGGTCVNGAHNNLPNGGPQISAYYPYTCLGNWMATPKYPG